LAILEGKGIKPNIIEYLIQPVSFSEIKKILSMMGKAPHEIIRVKDAKDENIDIDSLSGNDLIKAIIKYPRILERPIVVVGEKAVLCRPPENVLKIL
tara:strand:+ start:857 stop:1147 length:291 start_codon:yes stop_codon:yes gene_type:complete